ncbi:MAG: hypothetical protein ABEH35_06735, partial [Haloarculaceae archaeon]
RRQAREAVEEIGESDLRRLAEAHGELTRLFERYEDRAVGSGDFEAFVEFQEKIARFTEELDEDLPERERFEAVDDLLQQRRLSESDFERAREELAPVRDRLDRLEEWEQAREAYREARSEAQRRLSTVEDRIDDLERLTRLGEADLDAPVERLREPIDAYDQGVREAFTEFRRSVAARELFAFLETTTAYPLVPFDEPPEDLLDYLRSHDAGEEPITTLLEYAGYSNSKLDHYVDDPAALKRAVATRQTYLERLDAGPLTVGWPPPPAGELRWRCRELIAVVDRFAPDEVVRRLREVRALARREDYERLRDSAVARARLDESERRRLASGEIDEQLDDRREERQRLVEALEEHPRLQNR